MLDYPIKRTTYFMPSHQQIVAKLDEQSDVFNKFKTQFKPIVANILSNRFISEDKLNELIVKLSFKFKKDEINLNHAHQLSIAVIHTLQKISLNTNSSHEFWITRSRL